MLYKMYDDASFQFDKPSSNSVVSRSAIGVPEIGCRVVCVLSNPVPSDVNMSRGSHAEMGGHKGT